jgi:preprotein translocase subunit SecA
MVTGQLMHIQLAPDMPLFEEHELPEMQAYQPDVGDGLDHFALAGQAIDAERERYEADMDGEVRTAPIRNRISAAARDPNNPETWGKVKRNEACPCGSGKKYKQCHGKL